ncbi:Peroxin-3 [Scleroderma citrinum]
MFDSLKRYVYDRRLGLLDATLTMGTTYAASAYVRARLEDMKEKVVRQRMAKDSLRRRFQATHDDACYTIMALIPTLATQILEEMDVESLTNELQSLSGASGPRSPSRPPPPSQYLQSASETSSVSDAQSEAGSMSLSSYSGSGHEGERTSGLGSGSWVERMSTSESSQAPRDLLASSGRQLSDSIVSTSSSLSHNGQNTHSDASSASSSSKKRKAQLWKEVKNLTLTRALTTLYTTTLLSLLTAAQVTLLARSRYIASVRASERAERAHDQIPRFSMTGILAREAIARIVDIEALCPKWLTDEEEDLDVEDINEDVSELTQMRFLTLSWWILHVGWKDVASRVRGVVENVFDGVSLRTKLSCQELRDLILDVRRHVELVGATERPHSRFMSSLLPPTPETTAHVLTQGGAFPMPAFELQHDRRRVHAKEPAQADVSDSMIIQDGISPATAIDITSPKPRTALLSSLGSDPRFMSLLVETQAYLSGPDFAYALTCALDRATSVLMDGLRARVFVDTGNAVNPTEGDENEHQDKDRQGSENPHVDVEVPKEEMKIRLVGLLPGLARWSQLALNATPNELVDNIMAVREVSALEAIIISDYQDCYPPIV